MQIKITKKKKPYIRIAYAMLYKKQSFKKNDRIQNYATGKLGRIDKIIDNNIIVIYDDKSTETLNKKQAYRAITAIVSTSLSHTPVSHNKTTTFKSTSHTDRITAILEEAVKKGEIAKDDMEVKRLELETLSEQDLTAYEQSVHESYDENITEAETEPTEAEKALASLRATGKIADTSLEIIETTSRSLEDAKLEHMADLQAKSMSITKDNSTKDGLTFEYGLEQMKNTLQNQAHTFVRPKEHSMQNLQGITTPIIQQSKELSIKDKLANIEWTTFGCK